MLCLGIFLLAGSNGCDGVPTGTPGTPVEPSASPTVITRPPCLTLIQPAGNTVCGYIINEFSGKPVVGRPVYLAKGLLSSDNSVVLASLDKITAPRGVTDENGMFFVIGVPADLYFLMLDDYPQPMMLREPDNPSNDLIVDWRESSEPIDLGVISARVLTPDPSP